ncbi:MAG: thiamine-phosphate kinase [Deltaproteobacteria bacterium]|nr:thiamine-phosphate kinase [Deltaproteobacteria bacterium]
MNKWICSLGEDALIDAIARRHSAPHRRLIKGMGDDASVTVQHGGRALLATTDILIEGVHFKKGSTTPYLLGRKSLSVSLSDIAAMGGSPAFHLVSLAMPPRTPKAFVDGLYEGISGCAGEFGSCLAGGNTARLPERIMISTTVFGEMPMDEVVYRSGARPGDVIYVTGALGASALGLLALKTGRARAMSGPYKDAVLKHLDPAPRLAAGRTLARKRLATAMMDISDGLGIDLKRLCEASRVGAEVEIDRIPVPESLMRHASRQGVSAASFAVAGGEDYELLFTASARNAAAIERVSAGLGLGMTAIGRIVAKGKAHAPVFMDGRGARVKMERLGFEHF